VLLGVVGVVVAVVPVGVVPAVGGQRLRAVTAGVPAAAEGVVERVGVEEEEQGVAVGVAALPPSAAAALLA
jgi:hypothetical protein